MSRQWPVLRMSAREETVVADYLLAHFQQWCEDWCLGSPSLDVDSVDLQDCGVECVGTVFGKGDDWLVVEAGIPSGWLYASLFSCDHYSGADEIITEAWDDLMRIFLGGPAEVLQPESLAGAGMGRSVMLIFRCGPQRFKAWLSPARVAQILRSHGAFRFTDGTEISPSVLVNGRKRAMSAKLADVEIDEVALRTLEPGDVLILEGHHNSILSLNGLPVAEFTLTHDGNTVAVKIRKRL